MMTELLPCPFCGSKGKLKEVGYVVYVKCSNKKCGVETETYDECDTPIAIEAWNTRYEPTCRIIGERDSLGYMSLVCSECKSIMDDDDNFCSKCGAKVVDE